MDILSIEYKNNCINNYDIVNNNIIQERNRSIAYFNRHKYPYYCYTKSKLYYGYALDKNIREQSTSGGFCAVASKFIIDNNGIVYGASYTDGFRKVKTISVDNMDSYYKYISKSKYNFCYMPLLEDIKKQLENDVLILYIGSPCQILSLKKYLNKKYDNLITIDLICHGYSSQKKLIDFINKLEKEYNSKIIDLDMRPCHKTDILVKFENGKNIFYKDVFSVFLFNNIMDRCKKCKMNHGKTSNASDITVGDFWANRNNCMHLDNNFDPEKGTNFIKLNTEKGINFFDKIKNNLNYGKFNLNI